MKNGEAVPPRMGHRPAAIYRLRETDNVGGTSMFVKSLPLHCLCVIVARQNIWQGSYVSPEWSVLI